ncbi:hypothetical protein AVEN_128497-1 [Araneus ventricosus]|uniref:Uncharacterized protein n=1 Tax=Araneus ventricosus TaxID=182803 RepID=A0A4Y2FPR0_ARAVE|nr:hypothetical protein AVEN_128497-1 [Araneus ventricosus]
MCLWPAIALQVHSSLQVDETLATTSGIPQEEGMSSSFVYVLGASPRKPFILSCAPTVKTSRLFCDGLDMGLDSNKPSSHNDPPTPKGCIRCRVGNKSLACFILYNFGEERLLVQHTVHSRLSNSRWEVRSSEEPLYLAKCFEDFYNQVKTNLLPLL